MLTSSSFRFFILYYRCHSPLRHSHEGGNLLYVMYKLFPMLPFLANGYFITLCFLFGCPNFIGITPFRLVYVMTLSYTSHFAQFTTHNFFSPVFCSDARPCVSTCVRLFPVRASRFFRDRIYYSSSLPPNWFLSLSYSYISTLVESSIILTAFSSRCTQRLLNPSSRRNLMA